MPTWVVKLQLIYRLKSLTAEGEHEKSPEPDDLWNNLHKSHHEKFAEAMSCHYLTSQAENKFWKTDTLLCKTHLNS